MDVKLIMFRGDGSKRTFQIHPGATSIGRKQDCDIRIPLVEVSRRHAEIVLEDEMPMVRDLGAANGTYLNNRRVTEEDLEPGDQIMIGPVVFTVQIDGDPGDEEIIEIRSRGEQRAGSGASSVGTSKYVAIAEEETDPIAALEALASSADQTAINPEDDDEEELV